MLPAVSCSRDLVVGCHLCAIGFLNPRFCFGCCSRRLLFRWHSVRRQFHFGAGLVWGDRGITVIIVKSAELGLIIWRRFLEIFLSGLQRSRFFGLSLDIFSVREGNDTCNKVAGFWSLGAQTYHTIMATKKTSEEWKQIAGSGAAVSFHLTGDSVIRAASLPTPPGSKTPTVIRVSHSNGYGPVDSDVFVRLGNPKKPLDVQDFDTVSDWRKAELVEDLTNNEAGGWKPRGKAEGEGTYWCGTYEVEVLFPKGHHQIELKIISRVPQVCSIVLSNWKVYVR